MMRSNGAPGSSDVWGLEGFEVSLLRGVSPEREQWEQALLRAGKTLPLQHRVAWAALDPSPSDSWLIAASDPAGRPCGAAAVQVSPSRALPGHLIMRCERFGPGLAATARRAVLCAFVSLAQKRRRVLRLVVETFAIEPTERAALEEDMRQLGFSRVRPARSYEHTLLVPLEGDEESVFASLHPTARRHVRAANKNPVRVGPVDDPAYFGRLDELSRETYARTGGTYDPPDWSKLVALSISEPSASRLVGLHRTDIDGPASLLAFAWGCAHGDHAQYSRAASTRATDIRMPLMYPVVWDLICWAKRTGALYFDFGGITVGSHRSDDPLGGISDFKRYFSERAEQVGAEWALEPRPLQAHTAKLVSSASSLVARVLIRSRRSASGAARRSERPVALIDPPVTAAARDIAAPASRNGNV